MKANLREKFRQGRPLELAAEEAEFLLQTLREAMAVTLEREPAEIGDGALVFDELGLDSVDVFDLLDQLAEKFEVQVEMEELPEAMIYGREGMTFREFAEALIAYFRSPPAQA